MFLKKLANIEAFFSKYLMTPFILKWHWDLGTGCSSLNQRVCCNNHLELRHRLVQACQASWLTSQTPRTPKEVAGAAATCEASWEPGGCPDPGWYCGVFCGKVSQISAPPSPPRMSLVLKAHRNVKFHSLRLRLRYRLKRMKKIYLCNRNAGKLRNWTAVGIAKLVI